MKKNTYIERMSYESFIYSLNKAHEMSGKSKVVLFFDILGSYLSHGADFADYSMLGFWDLNKEEKKTYITDGRNSELIKKYNDKKYFPLLEERHLFNEKFQNYLQRDFFYIDDNFDEFERFIKDRDEIIVKTNLKNGNVKIQKMLVPKKSEAWKLYKQLEKNKFSVIEEVLQVHPELVKLAGPDQVSIHFTTLYKENDSFLINAFLKVEGETTFVTPIDLDTGKTKDVGCDSDLLLYEKHPITHKKIEGFKIPYFKEAKECVLQASKELPRLRYVDWNILIGEDGPAITSATPYPNYSFYQFPIHTHHRGLLPIIEEIDK